MRSSDDIFEEILDSIAQYIHKKTGYPIEVIKDILRAERSYYGLDMAMNEN